MKIFVTGATGFIGSNLLHKLIEQKHEVVALVRNEESPLPKEVQRVTGTLKEFQAQASLLRGCGGCIHLAAMVSFAPSAEEDLLRTNYEETIKLIEECQLMGLKRFVFVSSACTIGISKGGKTLDESSPFDKSLLSHNIYLKSKRLAEEKIESISSGDMEIVTVNPTTVYGSGDYSLNSGTLIKKVIESSLVPVPPGGTNVVDVEDVSKGIIAALIFGKHGERYILGGYNLTFRDIVQTVADAIKEERTFVPIPSVMRGVAVLAIKAMGMVRKDRLLQPQIIDDIFSYKYYSSEKAEGELKWKARKSFSQSVSEAIDYYRSHDLI